MRELAALKLPNTQALVTRVKLPDYWRQYGPPDACDFKGDQLMCH